MPSHPQIHPHIKITTYGNKPSKLVLLSGWNHSFNNEQPFLSLLAKTHTVLVVSLPGYDGVPDSPILLDFPTLALAVRSTLESHQALEAQFLGFSMGCQLLAELAQLMPIKNPILIGCPLGVQTIPWWGGPLLRSQGTLAFLRKSTRFTHFVVTLALRSVSQEKNAQFSERAATLRGAFDSLIGLLRSTAEITPFLQTALFVYGELDPYRAVAKETAIQHQMSIPSAAHACIWGYEQELVEKIQPFLEKGSPTSNDLAVGDLKWGELNS